MYSKINAVVSAYNRYKINMVKGEGVFLFDDQGKKYLDFTAGIATTSLGHCHPYIINKITHQLNNLWHCSNIFTIPGQQHLAQRLTELTFADKVFFCSSGVEAIEAAIKFIRRYYYNLGQNKYRIITLQGGFHGRSLAAISAGGNAQARAGYYPLLEGFDQVPRNDINAIKDAITPKTAAILLEPIQSEGGIHELDINYLQELRKITKDLEILLCFDEIQTGYGRIGKLFYHQLINIEPDILTCAKAMGNGFPLAACLVKDKIASAITPGSHGSTYGGNPLAMCVGNAVLDLILDNELLEKVQTLSPYFKNKLLALAQKFPELITEIRGQGYLLGIETKISATKIVTSCLEQGLILTKVADDKVIRILPPLIIEKQHIDQACNIIDNVFSSIYF